MASTSQQSSQELISDWFQKAAEMTEAAMMATARMQLATLDQFMETMTAGRSLLEAAPTAPQKWLEGAERRAGERKAAAQEPGQKKPGAKKKAHAKRSRPHKRR